MISLISSLTLKVYLNSLVYHRNIFWSSSEVFGNLRTSLEIFGNSWKNVRERSNPTEVKFSLARGDPQISFKGVIAKGDLVYRQYILLPAPKHKKKLSFPAKVQIQFDFGRSAGNRST